MLASDALLAPLEQLLPASVRVLSVSTLDAASVKPDTLDAAGVKEYNRAIKKPVREYNRERNALERQEKKLMSDIKKAASQSVSQSVTTTLLPTEHMVARPTTHAVHNREC